MKSIACRTALLAILFWIPGLSVGAFSGLDLIYPTPNENLLEEPSEFYMRTVRSGPDPWKGGMYGFSRNARTLRQGTVNTRFHEGVDIAPTMRDDRGEPLDTVVAIDDGVVVHVNSVSGHSNYGQYIVVQHIWDGSPFYSLYAHLNDTYVETGMGVRQGAPLGRLGYTGAGINRTRAHLHFEIAMLVNRYFDTWYDNEYGDGRNYHRHFNGLNLAGVNVARLYERLCNEPDLGIRQFIREEHQPFYTVRLPRTSRLDLLSRYPWLLKESALPHHRSWEITFDASGLPLAVHPRVEESTEPIVDTAASTPFPYKYVTKYRLAGTGNSPRLSGSGHRFIRLVQTEPDSATLASMSGLFAFPSELKRRRLDPPVVDVIEPVAPPFPQVDYVEPADAGTTGSSSTASIRSGSAANEERGGIVEEPDPEEERGGSAGGDRIVTNVRSSGAVAAATRSEWHHPPYRFDWEINPKGIADARVRLAPIRVQVSVSEDELEDVGVERLLVTAPELARYGMAIERPVQISETTWAVELRVKKPRMATKRLRELDGKVLRLNVLLQFEDDQEKSVIEVRTLLR